MANKTDLATEVQGYLEGELKLNKKEATLVVDAVIDSIMDLTVKDAKLQLTGFGTFEVRERAARKGRNPQTGSEIEIPASKGIGFKVGKQFKQAIK